MLVYVCLYVYTCVYGLVWMYELECVSTRICVFVCLCVQGAQESPKEAGHRGPGSRAHTQGQLRQAPLQALRQGRPLQAPKQDPAASRIPRLQENKHTGQQETPSGLA